jgi:hypothetical protein
MCQDHPLRAARLDVRAAEEIAGQGLHPKDRQ